MGRYGDSGGSERRPHHREPLSAEAVETAAERLRLIADPRRIALLEALYDGEASVQELAERIGSSHQNASYHLAKLRRAGVVECRREGPTRLYAMADWSAWWVVEQLARI